MFDTDTIDMIADRVLAWQEQTDTTLPILEREIAEVEKSAWRSLKIRKRKSK